MEQCKYFDSYQAIYPPRCGCRACNDKWNTKQEESKRQAEQIRRREEDDLLMAATITAAMASMF